jgi:hypothetical protein
MKTSISSAVLALLLAAPLRAQDAPDVPLQGEIDDAIRPSVEYLKKTESLVPWEAFGGNSDELILWTFVHELPARW